MQSLLRVSALFFALNILFFFGCGGVDLVGDEDLGSSQGALTAEDCEESCMSDFHECKDSPNRGGGPGASACAHEKNDCQSQCN